MNNDWQPIETAPKDRPVLLAIPNGQDARIVTGQWHADEYGARRARPLWLTSDWKLLGVGHVRCNQPTHWMPLPEMPTAV